VKEHTVEEYLRTEVIKRGGRCDKVVNLTRRGQPDREVQWPVRFWGDPIGIDKIELKRPKGVPEGHQERLHEFLASCGVPVYLLDTVEKVDRYIAARYVDGDHARELFSVPVPTLDT
jgi:hypothetical protein